MMYFRLVSLMLLSLSIAFRKDNIAIQDNHFSFSRSNRTFADAEDDAFNGGLTDQKNNDNLDAGIALDETADSERVLQENMDEEESDDSQEDEETQEDEEESHAFAEDENDEALESHDQIAVDEDDETFESPNELTEGPALIETGSLMADEEDNEIYKSHNERTEGSLDVQIGSRVDSEVGGFDKAYHKMLLFLTVIKAGTENPTRGQIGAAKCVKGLVKHLWGKVNEFNSIRSNGCIYKEGKECQEVKEAATSMIMAYWKMRLCLYRYAVPDTLKKQMEDVITDFNKVANDSVEKQSKKLMPDQERLIPPLKDDAKEKSGWNNREAIILKAPPKKKKRKNRRKEPEGSLRMTMLDVHKEAVAEIVERAAHGNCQETLKIQKTKRCMVLELEDCNPPYERMQDRMMAGFCIAWCTCLRRKAENDARTEKRNTEFQARITLARKN